MTESEKGLTTSLLVGLSALDDTELVAFNLAVQLGGKVDPTNRSYKKAVDLKLIREDGSLWDIEATQTAAAIAVDERLGKKDAA